ncbi:TPA: hypothetical protein KNT04_002602 [Clostridioides difficile]|nr:hypothetical protein [Clostridioides difficile]
MYKINDYVEFISKEKYIKIGRIVKIKKFPLRYGIALQIGKDTHRVYYLRESKIISIINNEKCSYNTNIKKYIVFFNKNDYIQINIKKDNNRDTKENKFNDFKKIENYINNYYSNPLFFTVFDLSEITEIKDL